MYKVKSWTNPVVFNFKILIAVCETDRLWCPPTLLYSEYRQWNGRGGKLTTHLHLVSRLRMRGAVPLLPLCTIVAWAGTSLPLERCSSWFCPSWSRRCVTEQWVPDISKGRGFLFRGCEVPSRKCCWLLLLLVPYVYCYYYYYYHHHYLRRHNYRQYMIIIIILGHAPC